jgi:uncharacterized protein involved in exopolysaccharide biosynthesis
MEKNEIEFIDFLQVIWKKRVLIVVGTVLCMIIAGVVSFLLKPVYEIDAIIQPGKFFLENQQGNFDEVIVEPPQQIADKVNHESYVALIAQKLGVPEDEVPEIEAKFIEDTLLTRLWIRNDDVPKSKRALSALIDFLKEDVDTKIDVEIDNIDTAIKSNESHITANEISIDSKNIQKARITKEIAKLNNKLQIIENRKKEIQTEMKEVKDRIGSLEKEQMATLKKENKSETEALGLLLYSSEVQQNFQFYNDLQEMLSEKELSEEDISIQIEGKREDIKQLDNQIEEINNEIGDIKNQIANLKERKGRIDYTKIVKEPTSSIDPVSPKKKLNVLIAGIIAFLLLVSLVFVAEYFERNKDKSP